MYQVLKQSDILFITNRGEEMSESSRAFNRLYSLLTSFGCKKLL